MFLRFPKPLGFVFVLRSLPTTWKAEREGARVGGAVSGGESPVIGPINRQRCDDVVFCSTGERTFSIIECVYPGRKLETPARPPVSGRKKSGNEVY